MLLRELLQDKAELDNRYSLAHATIKPETGEYNSPTRPDTDPIFRWNR